MENPPSRPSGKGATRMLFINGEFLTLRPDTYYGGRHERGLFEYLYRLPDGRWFLHTVNVGTLAEPTFAEISEEEAVAWLIRSCLEEERTADLGQPRGG